MSNTDKQTENRTVLIRVDTDLVEKIEAEDGCPFVGCKNRTDRMNSILQEHWERFEKNKQESKPANSG